MSAIVPLFDLLRSYLLLRILVAVYENSLYELEKKQKRIYVAHYQIPRIHGFAMNTPLCPFCPFSDPSPYFLAQHIERLHSEPDEPSFVSRHFLEDDEVDSKEATTSRDAPSQDYIECECGEAVLLSEFDDHVQLHSAESADMGVGTTQLPAGVKLTAPQHSNPWSFPLQPVDLNTDTGADNYAIPFGHSRGTKSSRAKHDVSYDRHDKQHHTIKEWIDLLLGSNASPTRTKNHATLSKDVRRLGVSQCTFLRKVVG